MLKDLEGCIEEPLFKTCLGTEFEPADFEAAMKYEGGNQKAVLVFSK